MKTFAILAAAIGIAASGSAFAQNKPVPMSDAQMDKVTAGALLNLVVLDVVDVSNALNNNKISVAIPVNAAVAAGVLGNAAAGAVQRPGRITQ